MKTARNILMAACLLSLLSSCATYQGGATWDVKPYARIRDSSLQPEAFYQLGRYYQGQKRYDQAILAYRKSLAADEGYTEAHNGLGVVYALQGNNTEALEELRIAIRQSPAAAHIYNNLGYACYLQGLYVEAVAALEKSAELKPGNPNTYNNLGLAYAKLGNQAKSIQAFTLAAQRAALKNTGEAPVATANENPENSPRQVAEPAKESIPTLALPKDRGIITKPAANVGQAGKGSQLVAISPNVYELRLPPVPEQMVPPPKPTAKFRLEVCNGNGVTGMAKRWATSLYEKGLPKARLTNQPPYRLAASQIHYRKGYQTEALRLMASLPTQPMPIQSEAMRADTDVRLVLGKDAIATRNRKAPI